jgi:hypothetical protein
VCLFVKAFAHLPSVGRFQQMAQKQKPMGAAYMPKTQGVIYEKSVLYPCGIFRRSLRGVKH